MPAYRYGCRERPVHLAGAARLSVAGSRGQRSRMGPNSLCRADARRLPWSCRASLRSEPSLWQAREGCRVVSGGFGLVVRFRLRDPEAAAGFDALVARTLPEIGRREPGTLAYLVHSVPGEPLARVFYE